VAKHAPPPPPPPAAAEGEAGEAGEEGEREGGGEGGGEGGDEGGDEGDGQVPKRLNRLVPIGTAYELDELYEEAAAAEATGEGSGLVVVTYHLRSDAGCKKVTAGTLRAQPATPCMQAAAPCTQPATLTHPACNRWLGARVRAD